MVFFQEREYSRRDSFNTKYFNSPTCTLRTNFVHSVFLLHPITTATLWDDAIGRTTSGSRSTTLCRTIRHTLKGLRVEPSAPLDFRYTRPFFDLYISGKCSFDNGFCGWRNEATEDRFDWSITEGETPSRGTGPMTGFGGSGNEEQ